MLKILFILVCVAAAVLIAGRIFGKLYRNERRPDAIHFTRTADGWWLALHAYHPPAGVPLRRPVICCHGLCGNHHCYDLTERTSLARTLAAHGHPTFVLDLRGAGESDKGGPGRGHPLSWRLSDHYRYDAPAAIEKVRQVTGADRLHWIGHSMGGMTAYAFLQTPLAEQISRCVILASPATFYKFRPAHRFAPLLRLIPGVPMRILSQCVAPLFESFRPLQVFSGNIHLAPGDAALSGANLQDQAPSSLLRDFTRFIQNGYFLDDGNRNLIDGLRQVRTPILFMMGEKDQMDIEAIKPAVAALGSEEKKFVPLGVRYGHQTEYGHLTLLLGPHVQEEVFPEILAWLAKG